MTLVYLAAAWVSGIVLARALSPPWQLVALLGLTSGVVLLVGWDERSVRWPAAISFMAALGAARFLLAMPLFDQSSLATYNGVGRIALEGVVVGEPDERDRYTNIRLRAESLTLPDGTEREVTGLALIQAERYPRRSCGDRLLVHGLLKAPPVYEGFSYRDYLARHGIYSYMRGAEITGLGASGARPILYYLSAVKRRAQAVVAEMLPEPQAGLLTGILLGVESGIPDAVMDDFEATGTSHIIVISGFNLTLVAGVFAGVAGRLLHRRRALLVAMAGMAIYAILVGATPAVARAALMAGLYLLSCFVGRRSYPPVSLATACLVMTTVNPQVLWDSGFMLSFTATAGLLFYARPLEDLFAQALERLTSSERARRIAGVVGEGLLVTAAAQITTAPLLLDSFGQLSGSTLLSNVLVLPAQFYVIVVGGLATILGLVVEPLGRIVAWVAWLFLTYTLDVVHAAARLPIASWAAEVEGWSLWVYYSALGAATWWLGTPRKKRQDLWKRLSDWLTSHLETKMLFGASAILLALAFFAWRELPDGRLHVDVLDVGQGDAIFVETPAGRQVLIDGGPSPSVLLSQLGKRMPFWDRSLDLVVLTHPDEDHITGLVEVLDRYQVDAVLFREMGCCDPICERWDELISERHVTVYEAERGMGVALEEDVRMDVLHPGAALRRSGTFNDHSVVLRLDYDQISFLLTGDIEAVTEKELLAERLPVSSTVLKVAHHGGCSSSTQAFLEAVRPSVAVISVGEDNDFGHPCDEVLDRLGAFVDDRAGRPGLFRTDQHGTVELVTDGAHLWGNLERVGAPRR